MARASAPSASSGATGSHSNEPGARSALSCSDENRPYSAAAAAARGDRPRSTVPTKVPSAFFYFLHTSMTCTSMMKRDYLRRYEHHRFTLQSCRILFNVKAN